MPDRPAGAVPQAFPYQGSKRVLLGPILALFPGDGVAELVEPFAGSAAVSVGARFYGKAKDLTLSDVNAPLMALWDLIVSAPDAVVDGYAVMWQEQLDDPRQYYVDVRSRFNQTHDPRLLFFLLARCVKAAVRYSRAGDFNQGADHRRLGARPVAMAKRVHEASRLMQGALITSESYEERLIGAPRRALVYLDPPYQGTTDRSDHRYLTGLARSAFTAALAAATDNGVSFIVSYDAITEDGRYGSALPDDLGLIHRHVVVGPSSQATLSGKRALTTESIYVSPALAARLGGPAEIDRRLASVQAGG